MSQTIELTAASLETFLMYANDAPNWGWSPWVSAGNITPTNAQRGNLSDLVKKGLIQIMDGEGLEGSHETYIRFTDAGAELAAEHGIKVVAVTW